MRPKKKTSIVLLVLVKRKKGKKRNGGKADNRVKALAMVSNQYRLYPDLDLRVFRDVL